MLHIPATKRACQPINTIDKLASSFTSFATQRLPSALTHLLENYR
jgi:hypothetical protein